jgi:hypothetical protein
LVNIFCVWSKIWTKYIKFLWPNFTYIWVSFLFYKMKWLWQWSKFFYFTIFFVKSGILRAQLQKLIPRVLWDPNGWQLANSPKEFSTFQIITMNRKLYKNNVINASHSQWVSLPPHYINLKILTSFLCLSIQKYLNYALL